MSKRKNNKESVIIIKQNDLPLSCPRKGYLELSHPKVFLPIEKKHNKTIKCSYCSTIYQLDEDED